MARKKTGAICKFCGAQGLAWWHDSDKIEADGSRGGYRLTLPLRGPEGEPLYNTQTWTDKKSGEKRSVERLIPDPSKVHSCQQYRDAQKAQGSQGSEGGQAQGIEQAPESDDEASPESTLEQSGQSDTWGGEYKQGGRHDTEGREIEGRSVEEGDESGDGQGSEQGKGSKGKQSPEMSEAAQKAQQLAELLKQMAQGTMDEERVREIAREEDAKRDIGKAQTIKLRVERQGKEAIEIEGAHPLQGLLVTMLNSGIHVYLYGPRGSGKTTGAMKAAQALDLPYGYISLNPQTADSRVNGFLDANGVFRDTVFVKMYRDGGVMCIDEMDHASGNVLTALNGAIENGHASFPCGMVAKHEHFRLVATGNTPGRGPTPDHPERRGFDGATGDRFAYVYWPYDTTVEETATLAEYPDAGAWLAWVRSVREYAGQNDPRLVVSPRASIMGAKIIASGALDTLSGDRARQAMLADAVLFKGWDKDTVKRIMAACPMPDYKTLKGAQ